MRDRRRLREYLDFAVEALATNIRQMETVMSAQDAFKAAISDLNARLAEHDKAIQKAIGDLRDAFAANTDAAFQAAANQIADMSSMVAKETADIVAADTAPTPPVSTPSADSGAPPADVPAPAAADSATAPVAPVDSAPTPEPAPAPAPDAQPDSAVPASGS